MISSRRTAMKLALLSLLSTKTVIGDVLSPVAAHADPASFAQSLSRLTALLNNPGTDPVMANRHFLEFLAGDAGMADLVRSIPEPIMSAFGALESFGSLAEVGGSPMNLASEVDTLRAVVEAHAVQHSEIMEGTGRPVWYLPGYQFHNWGSTVDTATDMTFVPTTKVGIQNIVRWAAHNNKRVRAAGYRHSWNAVFGEDGGVIISMLQLGQVDRIPADVAPVDPADQLQGVQIVGTVQTATGLKGLCKVGSATTNQQFRDWMLSPTGGNFAWTLPLNVILSEITLGGSTSLLCHGAGLRHETLSDLIAEVEFVNAHGELQTVHDPELIKAAAGALGVLGIVTSLTFRLEPMSYANMRPYATPAMLAIPPGPNDKVPAELALPGVTKSQLDTAWNEFVRAAENDYYAEWFWFPYRPDVYVNTWNNDGPAAPPAPYLDNVVGYVQELGSTVLEQVPAWRALPGRVQADFIGAITMSQLRTQPISVPVIDALHFRRGVRNWPVRDIEVEIPLPPRADDPTKPDWNIARRAWWDAINLVYARPDAPMRVTLEMRVMGGSSADMAPAHGNSLGTCSIEVLSTQLVPVEQWESFKQQLFDAWAVYTDASGTPLNLRPHWAKEWPKLMRGRPSVEYLRDVSYAKQIPLFRDHLRHICAAGGVSMAELHARFSNPMFSELLSEVYR